jgi:type VI secretion system protein ImpL
MLSFFKRRAFLVVLGFVLLAAFIWYAGPYFAFADFRPLESVGARLIAIALTIGIWLCAVLLRRLRAIHLSDKLASAVVRQSHEADARPSAEAVKLRERFEEAVATLKQRRRGRQSLYDLPWYVIIGAPGSGKTTALLNSGLKFPLEPRVGRGGVRGVGGTRNCDWWFSDEAVFLDTAGRYTTQDSDAASDSAGWQEFLALLRKYRKRRPLNGVMLTISAHDLMVQGDSGREAHVEAARRRLRELNEQLRIKLPVYLMVTKCDLVAGFTQYFDDLAQDGRAQVWGMTFSYEQTVNGGAAPAFPAEFDGLVERLNARLFARVEQERDVRRRTAAFAFPQQMEALRDALARFVDEVFESSRFEQGILLRGVYFTSGTQEGTPIDRLLGGIGRRFGVAPDAVAAPTGRGKVYFIERLLKDVMIGESGLAGLNTRVEMQKAALQLGAYAALALVTVFGVVALSLSYGRNHAYIGETAADVAKLRDVPTVRAGAAIETILPRLDAVRAVVESADRYRGNTPWSMRWGLYQGESVGASARDAYLRELDGLALPLFAARVKERLSQNASEPEKLYEYLKAYLMLGEPQHLDKKQLQYVADVEWGPSSAAAGVTASLSKHFQSLLEYADTLRPVPLDSGLVAQARSSIRQASIPRLIYGAIKREYASDTSRALRLDVAAGVGVEQVLKRKSGVGLGEPIPSIYGRPVFKEATGTRMLSLVKQFVEDNWVWGEGGPTTTNSVKLVADVTDIYESDYITLWDGILNDLELVTFPTVRQTADALGVLAGPTSPLRGLLRLVADNTTLIDLPENAPSGAVASAKSAIADGVGKVLRSVQDATGTSTRPAGSLVTARFQPIQRLIAGASGAAPIDRILGEIGQLQQQLKSLGPDVGGTDPLEALSNPALRATLQTLQQDAASLPPLFATLVAQIGHTAEGSVISGATADLEHRYQQQVARECNDIVADRYPFAASSQPDVKLRDFARLFGANGVFDRFFVGNLANLVDVSRSPWAWRPGAVTGSRWLLAQFELAQHVREMFFAQGASGPQLSFWVTVGNLDNGNRRFVLQIDGQNFDDRSGDQRKWQAKWPASDPGFAAATFEDLSGAWPAVYKFDGPWALFRLIDAGRPQGESPMRIAFSFQQDKFRARATIESDTVRSPFAQQDWRQFRCGP